MENIPRNGVDGGSDDGEEKRGPDPMINGSPTMLLGGMKGLALMVDEWESQMVGEVETH